MPDGVQNSFHYVGNGHQRRKEDRYIGLSLRSDHVQKIPRNEHVAESELLAVNRRKRKPRGTCTQITQY